MRKTAWEKRALVEKNQNQDSFENFESKLKDTLNLYDKDKTELFAHFQALSDNPDDTDEQDLTDAFVHNVSRTFAKASLIVMDTASEFDMKKHLLTNMWLTDDNERVKKLIDLSGTEAYRYLDYEETVEIIDELIKDSQNTTELEENIIEKYKVYLWNDVNKLYGQLHPPIIEEINSEESFDQGPAVAELVGELEEIVCSHSQDYKEGLDDGCSIAYTTTDMLGELTSGFALDVVRWQDVDDDGNDETTIQYRMVTSLRRNCENYLVLPPYVRNYVYTLINMPDSKLPFTSEDLLDETTEVYVEFNYNLFASNDGAFWYGYGLTLRINGNEIYIPDKVAGPEQDQQSNEVEMADKVSDQELFDQIFSEDETQELQTIIDDAEQKDSAVDIIEAFSKNMADLYGLDREQHIARARVLAKEFSRLSRK